MTEIVVDTGVIIGFGWSHDRLNHNCCSFFDKFPMKTNSFFYPKKVEDEIKRKRDEISRMNTGFETELRRMNQFISQFLDNSEKIDYDKDNYFNSIFFLIQEKMKELLQEPTEKVSLDANHVTNYILFSLERGKSNDHFFITGDGPLHDIRWELWKTACTVLDEKIYFAMKHVKDYQ